jgi:hypothetical protein
MKRLEMPVGERPGRPLGAPGPAVQNGVRRGGRADSAAEEPRDDGAATDLQRCGTEDEVAKDLLVRADEVLLAGLDCEALERSILERKYGVEAQAPHVLGDDQQADAIRRAALQRYAEHERELTQPAEVARRLVDERLVPLLADREQHLAFDYVMSRRHVEEPADGHENDRQRVALLENIECNDVDALERLALGVRIDRPADLRYPLLNRLAFVGGVGVAALVGGGRLGVRPRRSQHQGER